MYCSRAWIILVLVEVRESEDQKGFNNVELAAEVEVFESLFFGLFHFQGTVRAADEKKCWVFPLKFVDC